MLLAVDDPPLDTRAALVGAGLLVVAGLVDWSLELRLTSPDEPGVRWRRLAAIGSLGIAALAIDGGLLAVVDLARPDGIGVEVLGAGAALATLGLVAWLARLER